MTVDDGDSSGAAGEAPGGAFAAGPAPRRARARPLNRPARDGPLYAALDLGTNNCRLLIAHPAEREFDVVDSFSRIVRLGEGVGRAKVLSEPAMDRAMSALKICAAKINRHQVTHQRLFATEACRRAANGEEFLKRVATETGLELSTITPRQEARLAVAGCAPLIDEAAEQVLVYDIGGGSTELIWVDMQGARSGERQRLAIALAGGGEAGEDEVDDRVVRDWVSVPLGMATLHEKFQEIEDQYDRFKLMSWYFSEQIENFGPPGARARDGLQIIGTSGATTTVAAAHLKLPEYDRSRVDGVWLPCRAIRAVAARLLAMSAEARARHPCIGRERSELIMAGVAILDAVLDVWPVEQIRVGDRGLREGAIFGMAQAHTPNAGWRA